MILTLQHLQQHTTTQHHRLNVFVFNNPSCHVKSTSFLEKFAFVCDEALLIFGSDIESITNQKKMFFKLLAVAIPFLIQYSQNEIFGYPCCLLSPVFLSPVVFVLSL